MAFQVLPFEVTYPFICVFMAQLFVCPNIIHNIFECVEAYCERFVEITIVCTSWFNGTCGAAIKPKTCAIQLKDIGKPNMIFELCALCKTPFTSNLNIEKVITTSISERIRRNGLVLSSASYCSIGWFVHLPLSSRDGGHSADDKSMSNLFNETSVFSSEHIYNIYIYDNDDNLEGPVLKFNGLFRDIQ